MSNYQNVERLKPHEIRCSECGEIAICEMVDIGVGEQQSGPFGCEYCGWVESPLRDFHCPEDISDEEPTR